VTSSHTGSPSRGMRAAPRLRTPRKGLLGRAGVLLVGCAVLVGCQRPVAHPGNEAATRTRVTSSQVNAGRPASITIPAVGVEARVVPVGLRPDRTMEVPEVGKAGWYEPGPRPGQPGPAVLVGHVDSRSGPAVFFRLHELRRGDRIVVGQAGGGTRSFLVDRVAKEALPVERIWSRTRQPVLRLITCGGEL
jgi:sortase (surface protein transpeptidase)